MEKDILEYKDNPTYYIFLILQLLIVHKDNNLFSSLLIKIEEFYEYLPVSYKQIFHIACGQNKEDENQLDEALDFYYAALNIADTKYITTIAEEYISTIYTKQLNYGKAHKYCVLAKKRLSG